MLDGWKTYIVIILMAIYNVLSQLGLLPGIDTPTVETFINVLLAILGLIFNKAGRNRIARTGKV